MSMNSRIEASARVYPLRGRDGPPRPHDPADRILAEVISARGGHASAFTAWEVRIFDPAGQFHCYFGTRGLLHLQLWQPYYRISILAPSRLTAYAYEAFPVRNWKFAAKNFDDIAHALTRERALCVPDRATVEALCATHVATVEAACAREPLRPAHSCTTIRWGTPVQ